jgi:uncharacterized RDD family membrane protein YckC
MEILDALQDPQKELRFAGFWIRLAAHIIDAVIVFVGEFLLTVVVRTILSSDGGAALRESGPIVVVVVVYAVIFSGFILYYTIMESSGMQGSLGKMAVGIKVGNHKGERISILKALVRSLSKILSYIIFFIGYIVVAFDSRKQGVHDQIANTYVFYK